MVAATRTPRLELPDQEFRAKFLAAVILFQAGASPGFRQLRGHRLHELFCWGNRDRKGIEGEAGLPMPENNRIGRRKDLNSNLAKDKVGLLEHRHEMVQGLQGDFEVTGLSGKYTQKVKNK